MNSLVYVGLDVHASSISASIARSDGGEIQFLGKYPHSLNSLIKALGKLDVAKDAFRICYEAGPTGFVLCRELRKRGYDCVVIAPTLIPQSSGDRVKTDKKDSMLLAKLHRSQMLSAVTLPDRLLESIRELTRLREGIVRDERKAKQKLSSFLLRYSISRPKDIKTKWSGIYFKWLHQVKCDNANEQFAFDELLNEVEHQGMRKQSVVERLKVVVETLPDETRSLIATLQSLRGVAFVTAVTLVTEIGDFGRFDSAQKLMGYAGMVPREYSSGQSVRRGGITKTGNPRVRRILAEAAHAYRFKASRSREIAARQANLKTPIKTLSWQCQKRLHKRYNHLLLSGKNYNKVMTAIGRELLGFVWAAARLNAKEPLMIDKQQKVAHLARALIKK